MARTEGTAVECKYCGHLFDQLSAYKQHERTHTGEKPYACKHCDQCFSQSSNSKGHELTRIGVKPYMYIHVCKHCKRGFFQLSDCKRQEGTHTGMKPYKCKHCEKSFSRLSCCKEHEERHTRDSSLKHMQHNQTLIGKHLQEPAADGGKRSCMLFSSTTEENSAMLKASPVGFVRRNLVARHVSSNIMTNI